MNNNNEPRPSATSINGHTFDLQASRSDFDSAYASMTTEQLEAMVIRDKQRKYADPAADEVTERIQSIIESRKA